MVHAAASGARKHTAITVDALNAAAANLELALAGAPNGLLPNGLND
jgi:ATP-dependent DNA helicase DinG